MNKKDSIVNLVMQVVIWVSVSIAVIFAMKITGWATPLWAFVIPATISICRIFKDY